MTDYLPTPATRALVEELADFRVGVTDLTSLHTVRAFRETERNGLRLRTFVLGNTGGVTGGTGGPAGTERAVCVVQGLPRQPHLVIEPDSWLARATVLFSGDKTLARGDGVRVSSREPNAWDTAATASLLALGRRHADTSIELCGALAVIWRQRPTAPWLLADIVPDLVEALTSPGM